MMSENKEEYKECEQLTTLRAALSEACLFLELDCPFVHYGDWEECPRKKNLNIDGECKLMADDDEVGKCWELRFIESVS